MEKNKAAKRTKPYNVKQQIREGLPRKVTSDQVPAGSKGARQIPGDSRPSRGDRAKVLKKGRAWHVPRAPRRPVAGAEGLRGKEIGRTCFHSYSQKKKNSEK